MISTLLALAAAQAAAAPAQPSVEACAALVKSAPEKAVQMADAWSAKGGGVRSLQCLGLALSRLERWAPAATAFEQAAIEAAARKDPALADLWVQAGNSWLAAGDLPRARKAFDTALGLPSLAGELRGEVHLDRARLAAAQADYASARADVDAGLKLVPNDAFAWFLSSALAVREERLGRAKDDITKAVSLAPDNADILLQAGTVAGMQGDVVAAQSFYEKAAQLAPESPSGKAAAAALAANRAEATSGPKQP